MSKPVFDPQAFPIHSVGDELAVPVENLSPAWLRQRFLQQYEWSPEVVDESFFSKNLPFRPASVLIPIVMRDEGLTVLLTERAAHLHHHPGQISFPGGRFEEEDIEPVTTALREAEEEIGLQREYVEILGSLPEYKTGTGYQVSPIVSLVMPGFPIRTDPSEVASIFEVPLSFLMDGKNHQRRSFDLPDNAGKRHFYAMPYEQHFIWGATAGMLRNLFHFLRA
ncbi:CoA pyrophosphatase [Undibacterium umbellatum]|uniref:CoA pyrophosphatase n=1 Tax=Undibacterium umbellatum TaxID=2762300 RepID=A0ABR6ZBU2_9BURK|nr:CoA pyrophosphatase [Undibacterium umbellatum]MBC3909231.1 CoA pyrophosphatase [Undibacterium umbellatum]